MRIASYIARLSGAIFVLTLLCIVTFVVTINVVENAGRLANWKGDRNAVFGQLIVFSAGNYTYQMIPIALFLSLLITATLLAQRGEILATYATGIGPSRVLAGFAAVVLATTVAALAWGEYVSPSAHRALQHLQERGLKTHDKDISRFYNHRNHWYRQGHAMLYLPEVDMAHGIFRDPVIYQIMAGKLVSIINAEQLTFASADNTWFLQDARVLSTSNPKVLTHARMRLALPVQPEDLIAVTGDPRQLSLPNLTQLIMRRRNAGFDISSHSIELQQRWAHPLLCIWFFAIAAPWVIQPRRSGSLAATIGSGVGVVAVLYGGAMFFRMLALGHKLPLALGAWGGGLLCLMLLPVSMWAARRFH